MPIYNVKDYIYKCVDSILDQTYSNFECILVDDGSTDGSGEIIDELAKMDRRLRIIHKENGGLSSARNAGLSMARGEWILHIDGDDYIDINTLKLLKKYIDNSDVDIVRFEYIIEYPQGDNIVHYVNREAYYGIVDKTTAVGQVLNGCSFVVVGAYRNNISKKVSFREDLQRGADSVYLLEIYDIAEKILVIKDALYYYVQRMGSLARSKITPRQLTVLSTSCVIHKFISSKYPMYIADSLDNYINTRISLYYNMYTSDYEDKALSDKILNNIHRKYKKLKKIINLSLKKRIKYSFFEFSPKLYCRMFEIIVNLIPGERYAMYKTIRPKGVQL